ncbi:MAG: prepilin-type N-terminal cleavage/methylation domain-containing protein [Sulfuriferula sp.]|nr:prepilin-type N-terminal cleavage/methylation domain-containing protein [Sulfuriferula sp.]
MYKSQQGFTLIELAIVLVIVGLLLGGVFKGQELITQAKIRNISNDLTGTTAAFHSYQDRYRALPGDDASAASRWTNPTTVSGNGNGQITGNYNDTTGVESGYFWQHLRLSGLVTGAATDATPPQNAVSGMMGIQSAGALGLTGLLLCSSNLPAKIAQAIDSQLDDGNAMTGQLRGELNTGTSPAPTIGATAPTTNYVDNGSNVYVVCKPI